MRNREYLFTVLKMLREGKTNKQIAQVTCKHRNTVSKYVNWLRANIAYDFTLVTNEILQKLESRINKMSDKDLISFLGKLIPQKIEAKAEYREQVEIYAKIDWNGLSDEERELAEKAARIYFKNKRGRSGKEQPVSIH